MLQNTEGPAAIGHVISTSPSFDTHLSMNAGRLTCVLGFTGPHKQSQLDSWHQPGPNGGSGLLFNILPSEPCRQSTVHFESPSVRLKEHRQWKKLSKKCSSHITVGFLSRGVLNESFEWKLWMSANLLKEPGDSGGPCVFLLHSAFAHRSRTRSPFALSWQWLTRLTTSNPLHCYSLLKVETIFGK